MRPLLRSLFRIVTATLAVSVLLLGLAAALITQPIFGTPPSAGGLKADPDRLRRHVEFLTTQASPRDSDHPENLDRAAAYLREGFSRTGARVRDQTFQARGRTYRNVIASFGPATGPLLVVGAPLRLFRGLRTQSGSGRQRQRRRRPPGARPAPRRPPSRRKGRAGGLRQRGAPLLRVPLDGKRRPREIPEG